MKISTEHLLILEAGACHGECFFLRGHLDRKTYTKINEILEACGGKWNRKARAHVFPIDAAEAIDQVITTGEVQTVKEVRDEFQFFATPPKLVLEMIKVADLNSPGMLVLEPSAGRGAIVDQIVEAGADVVMYELMPENVQYLRDKGYKVIDRDFLSATSMAVYDRVIMNPPFAKSADVKHVSHALTMVKPGGKLVAIMSAGVTFRTDRRTVEFREKVSRLGGTITMLPEKTFAESGTNVNTVLVEIPC